MPAVRNKQSPGLNQVSLIQILHEKSPSPNQVSLFLKTDNDNKERVLLCTVPINVEYTTSPRSRQELNRNLKKQKSASCTWLQPESVYTETNHCGMLSYCTPAHAALLGVRNLQHDSYEEQGG